MRVGRLALMAGVGVLLTTAVSSTATAQKCEGKKPRGGRWVASAELYLQKARNPQSPKDRRLRYLQALKVAVDGWAKQPDNPRNYQMAGQAYAGLGDYAGADSAFRKAEEMWSCYAGKIDTLRYNAWVQAFNQGIRYTQSEEFDKAIPQYINAWTVYKKLPQPMLQLGNIYGKQALETEDDSLQRVFEEKAIDAYTKALDALEKGSERLTEAQRQQFRRAAAFNLAQLLALEERFEEAAKAYRRFLAEDPENVDAISNAAVVMVRAAEQAADQAEELEEGPEKEALLAKADSLQDAANEYYGRLLSREDLEAEQYHNIGVGLYRIGRYEDAAVAFEKALELEPYRVNSLEQLGRAYFAAEKWDTLAGVANTLVERYPLNLDNLALLANAYRELGRLQDALSALERREALAVELTELQLEQGEGVYTVTGYVHNLKMESGAPLEIQFDFYDDAGEVVETETATLTLPDQGEIARFSVSTESSAAISGLAYRPEGSAQAQAGN